MCCRRTEIPAPCRRCKFYPAFGRDFCYIIYIIICAKCAQHHMVGRYRHPGQRRAYKTPCRLGYMPLHFN